ncbi:MAG: transposase [Candidatus Scalindua sp.]
MSLKKRLFQGQPFHLILHTPSGNLNRFAQRFNTAYIVYYNRRHKRIGHLYQGRYKAVLVEKNSYLLALSRYIHLNPVKIKKIKKLSVSEQIEYLWGYRWSSNLEYGLLRYRIDFMCYRDVLEYTGGDNKNGRKSYREFVEEVLLTDVESPFDDIKGQVVPGKSGFSKWRKRYCQDAGRYLETQGWCILIYVVRIDCSIKV